MSEAPSSRRLFFALWPLPDLQREAAALARRHVRARRPVAAERLHVTLVFLGWLEAAQEQRARTAAGCVAGEPFELRLDRLGHWAGRGISWLAPSQIPPQLVELHRRLALALEQDGFAPERRRFHPHMTLGRQARPHRYLDLEPLVWPVRSFHLLWSRNDEGGARYQAVGRWPLGEAAGG